jgi:hypothetical protein
MLSTIGPAHSRTGSTRSANVGVAPIPVMLALG